MLLSCWPHQLAVRYDLRLMKLFMGSFTFLVATISTLLKPEQYR